VGDTVGIAEGTAVGLALGAKVGTAVGAVVGLALGEALGLAEGVAVGEAVGLAEGAIVGCAVGPVRYDWNWSYTLFPHISTTLLVSCDATALESPPSADLPQVTTLPSVLSAA
jgi:hypothetical protein